jgi:hypothetical protein
VQSVAPAEPEPVVVAMLEPAGPVADARAGSREQPQKKKTDAEKKQEAFDLVLATIEALAEERDVDDKIWGSMIKQTLKRQRPGFNESYHGFRSFNQLLEEAGARKMIELEKDEKSGGYVVRPITG